jgi:hypothetical protein
MRISISIIRKEIKEKSHAIRSLQKLAKETKKIPDFPTPRPGILRLAVDVEDHPLECINFEGTIPKGEYGGGMMWKFAQGRYQFEAVKQMGLEGIMAKQRNSTYAPGKRSEGISVKGIFVGNAGRKDAPQAREQLLFEKNNEDYARIKDIVILRSLAHRLYFTGEPLSVRKARGRPWRSAMPMILGPCPAWFSQLGAPFFGRNKGHQWLRRACSSVS